jgi:hypothetical protein
MNFLKNIAVNLKATGPAAVMAVWVISVAALGIFGSGPLAEQAMLVLQIFGGSVLVLLALQH